MIPLVHIDTMHLVGRDGGPAAVGRIDAMDLSLLHTF